MLLRAPSLTAMPTRSMVKLCSLCSRLSKRRPSLPRPSVSLKVGGHYGIHELGIKPDDVSEEVKEDLFKELSETIRVHARPMTTAEWTALLEEQGFKIIRVEHNPMLLLERSRIIQDEGWLRMLLITFNLLRFPEIRKRVKKMKACFRKYRDNLDAVAIIAQKP